MDKQLLPKNIGAIVRHGLTAVGGWLAGKGLIDTSDVETGAGAGVFLIGLGWSVYRKWRDAR